MTTDSPSAFDGGNIQSESGDPSPAFQAGVSVPGSEKPSALLSAVETRILGCLLEKERTTPEVYPLSLNSLTNACNQSSNRDPVVSYDEKVVEQGIELLREKKLASVVWGGGARVQKFKHTLLEEYELNAADTSVMCVLLLRGAQTLGEIRTRTERLHSFSDLGELDACLKGLMEGAAPLVRVLPAGPGKKEKRYIQLLSAEMEAKAEVSPFRPTLGPIEENRVNALEIEIKNLKQELAAIREDLTQFRKQFE